MLSYDGYDGNGQAHPCTYTHTLAPNSVRTSSTQSISINTPPNIISTPDARAQGGGVENAHLGGVPAACVRSGGGGQGRRVDRVGGGGWGLRVLCLCAVGFWDGRVW
jgi:hypothetical protein